MVLDTVGGTPLVVIFSQGNASALDAATIAASRDVGSSGVFEPGVGGRPLTFRADGDRLLDVETGSAWNTLGQSIGGPLAGQRLRPLTHGNHFWFAIAAFRPQVRVWTPE